MKPTLRIASLVWLTLLVGVVAHAQRSPRLHQPGNMTFEEQYPSLARTYHFEHLTTEQGLSNTNSTGYTDDDGVAEFDDVPVGEVEVFVNGEKQLAVSVGPNDQAGCAIVINGLSRDHVDYLAAGGYGFIIGDGKLNYGAEVVFEGLYSAEVVPAIKVTGDYQFVIHPGYDRDKGPVHVFAGRVHTEI